MNTTKRRLQDGGLVNVQNRGSELSVTELARTLCDMAKDRVKELAAVQNAANEEPLDIPVMNFGHEPESEAVPWTGEGEEPLAIPVLNFSKKHQHKPSACVCARCQQPIPSPVTNVSTPAPSVESGAHHEEAMAIPSVVG